MTLAEHVAAGRIRLAEAGVDAASAAFDAEVLARYLLGWDRASYLARARDPVPAWFPQRYGRWLERRAGREPVAQILGHREFWGLDFEVTRDVLTPRPETELIVEEALACASAMRAGGRVVRSIVDVGTGSGCLAVSLAREIPGARIVATDTSPAALAVARRNVVRHGVGARVAFVRTSLVEGIAGPVDLIVSNLPYAADADLAALPPEVRDFEPPIALAGGPDGLDPIRRLLDGYRASCRPAAGWCSSLAPARRMECVRPSPGTRLWNWCVSVPTCKGFHALPSSSSCDRTHMSQCLFCRIIAHELPASFVYEDEQMVAIDDIRPQAAMHVLVVPRRHIPTLNDLTAEDAGLVGEMVRRAAVIARERGFADCGYRTVFNCNRGAGQSVYHIHLHVLGGRGLRWPLG